MGAALVDRFAGCVLGLAVGDALGAHFEGRSPESIADKYSTAAKLVGSPPLGQWWYTDDTEMMLGVAETLIECGQIDDDVLSRRFSANYSPNRGYGYGARVILEAMQAGDDHKLLATEFFPGGSFGNGAAMRVAPVGLAFRDDLTVTREQARRSALPTHVHPLGIEGAQLIAVAVALASREPFARDEFVETLLESASHAEYAGPLRRAATVSDARDLALFGNGVAATDSVVTAIASFLLTPDDYTATVANAIVLGGDVDTIAAMAGAISGARLGASAIPARWLESLEDSERGRTYMIKLAGELHGQFGEPS
jgi:poly(ADP-ribose) glycohydrolase ARH3